MTRKFVVGLSIVFVIFALSSMALAGAMYYGDGTSEGTVGITNEGGNLFAGLHTVNAVRVNGGTGSFTMKVYDVATTPGAGLTLKGAATASDSCWADVGPWTASNNLFVTVVGSADVPYDNAGSEANGWFYDGTDWVTLASLPVTYGYMIEAASGARGDLNEDGLVLLNDALRVVDIVLGASPTIYETYAGDKNADCSVDVGDALAIVNAWLGL